MAYIKNTWVDREGTTRYFETVDEDGALILTPDYAQVTEIGTPVNADNMNHIEEGIEAGSFTKFDLNTTYFQNDLVTTIEDGSPVIYKSLIDNNIGNNLTNPTAWERISLGGGGAGLEIGDIGIAPLGIDESLGKRRYLNGSVIIQDQYQVFAERVKTAIQTYAGLGCTEEEWQTISSLSVGGQCGKFVVDDEAGTIRLPKIIMPIQGLTDLSKLGEIVSAGLPNITGKWEARQLTHQGQARASGALYVTEPDQYNAGTSADNAPNAAIGLDASLSNSIYGNSDTVQQEQIQYPYFIQVATGASVQDHITNEVELNNPFVLLEGQYFTAPVYNSSWLQSNAGFTGSLALHPTAYNALLVEQNPNVEVGTTVDNYTKRGLSVKLNTEAYTDYDFVLNTTSQTFRCPLKIKISCGGTAPVLTGEDIHTSGEELKWTQADGSSIGNTGNQTLGITANGSSTATKKDSFGNQSAEIVPANLYADLSQATNEGLYLYFYVGETVQNANLVNVGRVEEKLSDCITRSDCEAYITETYQNGTSWYRVYSDGWCEQGGELTTINVDTTTTVSLLKPYSNTNYSVLITATGGKRSNTQFTNGNTVESKNTTNFVMWSADYSFGRIWEAKGYIK